MTYTKIREIIQKEYDRNQVDSSYNFISRFATVIFNEQEKLKNKNESMILKSEIIETNDYLLTVTDDKINKNDWYITPKKLRSGEIVNLILQNKSYPFCRVICRKIVAHKPLNNSKILDGVDLF